MGKDRESGPPEWASFFSPEQRAVFLECVHRHFAERNRRVSVSEGVLSLKGDIEQRFGLLNLAQLCHAADERDWPEIIARHFGLALGARDESEAVEPVLRDFEAVADSITVRIWPEKLLAELGGHSDEMLIHRTDMEGTATVLVLDLPTSAKNVRPDEAAPWGKSAEELFSRGLENLPRLCEPKVVRHDLPNGQASCLLTGDALYVASYALVLDRFPGCVGTHGALVGVPNRHAVVSCPIENMKIVGAIGVFVQIVVGMARTGPGSISDSIYWYLGGRFTRLPYEITNGGLDFSPPGKFVEMLQELEKPPD